MLDDETDFAVGIFSQNLVTQVNFVEFRDGRNFHVFQGDGCSVDPKKRDF